MKEQESTKMEFLLTLNDNIVVQRYFNVRGYNPDVKNSLECYEVLKNIKNELEYYLKMKTVTYMMDNQELIIYDPAVMETSYTEGPEHFNIMIKANEELICHRVFDAKLYPPKVRYTVDVRPFLKDFLRDLTEVFSSKNLTLKYMNYELTN